MKASLREKKYDIARLFHELHLVIKQSMRREFECLGLTMPQTMVIGTLMSKGPMKVTELSETLGFTNSTTSGILDRLEKQDIIQRERAQQDRRVVTVSVTKGFLDQHDNFIVRFNQNFENLLQNGNEEELDKVLEGLRILKDLLRTDELPREESKR